MSSKQFININNKYDRVVVLVDMDCFYCQVEEKLNPEIRGKPIAVVQYNPWQGGGIIAVNYPARAKGVTRHMRGDEAKQHCPDIVLPQVPQVRGKADISKYRDAGKEVAAVLQTFTPLLERASIDEAYLDITEPVLARLRDMNDGKFHLLPDKLANTFAVGYDSIGEFVQKISGDFESKTCSQQLESVDDKVAYKKSDIKLLIGASIVNEIRAAVKEKTGFECSAGISHNKILAKLTAGFHKPNKQTILPLKCIPKMYETLSLKKVKGLGGKLGDQVCEVLKIQTMSELAKFPEKVLQNHFDERIGSWMFLMAKGIDLEAVTPKFNAKSIGCCKRFPGKNAISGVSTLKHWLSELANEIQERLEKDLNENNRIAKQMTVSYAQQFGQNDVSSTRSVPLLEYDAEKIAFDAFEAIKRNTDVFLKPDSSGALNNPIKFLGISAGKFEECHSGKKNSLKEMFSSISKKTQDSEMQTKDKKEESISAEAKTETGLKNFETQVGPSDINANHPKNIQNDYIKQVGELNESKITSLKKNGLKQMLANMENFKRQGETSKLYVKTFTTSNNSKESLLKADNQVLDGAIVIDDNKKDHLKLFEDRFNHNTIDDRRINKQITVSERDSCIINLETKLVEDIGDQYLSNTQPFIDAQEPKKAYLQSAHQSETIPAENETFDKTDYTLVSLKTEEKSSTNSDISLMDYRQTYAEFNRPLCLPEIVKKNCPECGNGVPENDFQSHLDFHFALTLSQQQREEFRAQRKPKLLSPASSTAKLKPLQPVSRRAPKTKVHSIDKFLASTSATNLCKDDAVTTCIECGKKIPTASMQEHIDYHVARKIQIELNKQEMQTLKSKEPDGNSNNTHDVSNPKKKRTANCEKNHPTKNNNLSFYFTKM